MTSQQIAELLHGRRAGRGTWTAKCPSHIDRSPSMSIREGRDGRTLLRCFAGCSIEAVLSAAGLRMADLFDGPPPTPQQAREAARARTERETEESRRRAGQREINSRYRKLMAVHDAMGKKLADAPDSVPDDAALTKLYHEVLEKLRVIEASFEAQEAARFHEKLQEAV
jgi:hypothetical protein